MLPSRDVWRRELNRLASVPACATIAETVEVQRTPMKTRAKAPTYQESGTARHPCSSAQAWARRRPGGIFVHGIIAIVGADLRVCPHDCPDATKALCSSVAAGPVLDDLVVADVLSILYPAGDFASSPVLLSYPLKTTKSQLKAGMNADFKQSIDAWCIYQCPFAVPFEVHALF